MSDSVLVMTAHPDDEVLGCGGTLAKLSDQGAYVNVVFLSDGVLARDGGAAEKQAELTTRRAAAEAASHVLGVKSVAFENFPDNQMDKVALLDIIKVVERHIAEFRPAIVLTHHAGDLNVDHHLLHQAVVTACRPQIKHPVKTLLFFEVPSSTEWQTPGTGTAFMPNWFSDISSTLDRKLRALDVYTSELRPWPHPRSRQGVEHLARWRGATVGVDAAEAFMLGRRIS